MNVAQLKHVIVVKVSITPIRGFHVRMNVAQLKQLVAWSLRWVRHRFHVRMNVAQLKRNQAHLNSMMSESFPRSNERGSIEASWLPFGSCAAEAEFPRSNERGSIEASAKIVNFVHDEIVSTFE